MAHKAHIALGGLIEHSHSAPTGGGRITHAHAPVVWLGSREASHLTHEHAGYGPATFHATPFRGEVGDLAEQTWLKAQHRYSRPHGPQS